MITHLSHAGRVVSGLGGGYFYAVSCDALDVHLVGEAVLKMDPAECEKLTGHADEECELEVRCSVVYTLL